MARAWDVPGLRGDARFAEAGGRIVLTRWREMMSYRDGTLAGEDIEDLHDMRVASRRLRAAMDAFAAAFPEKSFKRYLRQVKEITDVLGEARDLDVAIDGLLGRETAAPEAERPGLEGLVARYRTERAAETRAIADLFRRLDADDFGPRLERWVRRHTGVSADRLDPVPPAG